MIARQAQATLQRLAKGFPILVITGPRQSGKTTLARLTFPDHRYVSLEDIDEREFARTDPRGFLARFVGQGIILDEVQRVPDLLSYLQTDNDLNPVMGRIVLTGSQQFGLLAAVTQSLAGRAGMIQLLPLSLSELNHAQLKPSLDEVLSQGLYPALYQRQLLASDWYSSYVATYVERDVRQLLQIRDLAQFTRFLKLCAARTGQLLNISSLANDAGISQTAAKQWLSVLEASYLIFLLQPYYENFGKRLTKTPKLYFYDTGLAAFLLGIQDSEQMNSHSARPALFETLIVSDLLKKRWNAGQTNNLYFWRDHVGLEVDVVMTCKDGIQPIEIKSGQTIASDWFNALNKWQGLSNSKRPAMLIYGGDESYVRQNIRCQGWYQMSFDLC